MSCGSSVQVTKGFESKGRSVCIFAEGFVPMVAGSSFDTRYSSSVALQLPTKTTGPRLKRQGGLSSILFRAGGCRIGRLRSDT